MQNILKYINMNFTLIGMPAAGKSFLGKRLAERAGFKFLDIDEVMEEESGFKLPTLAEQLGEEGFLVTEEAAVLAHTSGIRNTIISTGGSVVYRENAMRHLRAISKIAYLKASCALISKRIGGAPRGIIGLRNKTLEGLLAERTPLYELYADVTFDVDRKPEVIVEEMSGWIRHFAAQTH